MLVSRRLPILSLFVAALAGCGTRTSELPSSAPGNAIFVRLSARVPDLAEVAAPAVPLVERPASTWSHLFDEYFAAGTEGGCGRSSECHASEMRDARSAYGWLQQRGYIDGAQSALTRSNSCLGWFGGNMPPKWHPDPQATVELKAWVAAGALDN
jgi:hypothetical protein